VRITVLTITEVMTSVKVEVAVAVVVAVAVETRVIMPTRVEVCMCLMVLIYKVCCVSHPSYDDTCGWAYIVNDLRAGPDHADGCWLHHSCNVSLGVGVELGHCGSCCQSVLDSAGLVNDLSGNPDACCWDELSTHHDLCLHLEICHDLSDGGGDGHGL